MEWWLIGFVIVIFLVWLGNRGEKKENNQSEKAKKVTSSAKPSPPPLNKKQAKELRKQMYDVADMVKAPYDSIDIVGDIDSVKKYKALERRVESAQERVHFTDYKTRAARDKAEEKLEVLEGALRMAEHLVLEWQFVPYIDLETPKVILEKAYKTFSNDEYDRLVGTFGDKEKDWVGLAGQNHDCKEEPDPAVKALIKFRDIVESDLSKEEQVKKINQLVSRNKILIEDGYFEDDPDWKPADQWFDEYGN